MCASGACVRPFCGDGVLSAGEHCDNGRGNSPDAYGPGQCTELCREPPFCGDGKLDRREGCDQGVANRIDAYGESQCSTECKRGGHCGDGTRNGDELCDDGQAATTAIGACTPECTGFYVRKTIKHTAMAYSSNLGGIAGADRKCENEFGPGHKALIVGGSRRATLTPLLGDGQTDWVIRKYTHYYNARNELVWRTDDLALLGVRNGSRVELLANGFYPQLGYPWSGYATDWTTIPEQGYGGTCRGWTFAQDTGYGSFVLPDLRAGAGEPCGRSRTSPLRRAVATILRRVV